MQEPKTTCEASGYAAMGNPGVSWTLAGVGAASSSTLPDGQYSSDLRGMKNVEKLRMCIFLRFLEEFHVEFGYEFSVHSDTPPFLAVIHRVWLL